MTNNFVTNPWSIDPREPYSQQHLDPAILTPLMSHLDKESVAKLASLNRASKTDIMIKSKMQSMYNAIEKDMFAALVALFNAMHKFNIDRQGDIYFLITFDIPNGVSVTERLHWVERNVHASFHMTKRSKFHFWNRWQILSTSILQKSFNTKIPQWFTQYLGQKITRALKNKIIWVYFRTTPDPESIQMGTDLVNSIADVIPTTGYEIQGDVFEIAIPFDGFTNMQSAEPPIATVTAPPQQQTQASNVEDEDRRRRRQIDEFPIFGTYDSQRLLYTGDLDHCIARRREMIQQRRLAAGGKKTKGFNS